jgi:16S rRNA (guanine966-N2)-methyltransferase
VRIVGGKFAGKDLISPSDFRVRPTAEHVRAGLLDLLADDLKDASCLDLFAGTGALGLEAISRGARRCDFVETRPSSLASLKANVVKFRLKERTRIFKKDALPFAAQLNENAYDLVFCDPPYESKMLDRVIEAWQARKFTKVLAVEHARVHKLPKGALSRTFEDTTVTIYRLPDAPAK